MTSAPRAPRWPTVSSRQKRGAAVHRLPARAAARVRSMDRALLVKNAVSTVCQERGHAGCCDNSPGRHATAHLRLAGYPVIPSYEPGEDWYWCYLDQFVFELQGAAPVPSQP
jgi:hypothetical protein